MKKAFIIAALLMMSAQGRADFYLSGSSPLFAGGGFLMPPASIALASIDYSGIDWQGTSGSWGSGATIVKPTEPTTTRSVTVHNSTDFNTEAATAQSEITIGTGWSDSTTVFIDADDIRVIIPEGVSIGDIRLGTSPYTTTRSRIRIQGSTAGEHSGGQMGTLTVRGATRTDIFTDIIVDGVDMVSSPSGTENPHMIVRGSDANRIALLNVRGISSCYGWLGGATHVTIAYSNFISAATNDSIGCTGNWGFRNGGGPIAFFNVRWDAPNLFAVIRSQPTSSSTDDLFWAENSTFINVSNGRNQWAWEDVDSAGVTGEGQIYVNSEFYSHADSGCTDIASALFATTDSDYTEARDSTFYAAGSSSWSNLGTWLDTSTNNTTTTFSALPAWTGPGDPTTLSLPSGITKVTNGTGTCTYP